LYVVAVDPGKNWGMAPDTHGFVHNQLHPSLRSLYEAVIINILDPLAIEYGCGSVAMAVVVLLWLRYG